MFHNDFNDDNIDSIIIEQVREDPTVLAQIEYPSENFQFVCICMNPKNILYMNNYTEYVESLAVINDPDNLIKIKNPYEQTIVEALSRYPRYIIDYDRKISDEAKLKIIELRPSSVLFFNHEETKFNRGLDYNMIWKAVYNDPRIIFNIMVKKYYRKHYFTEELLLMSITQCWHRDFYNRVFSDYLTYLHEQNIEITNEQYDRIIQKINKLKLSKGPMD
ncbi:hypothetical protein PBI_SCTP2_62 [Salicola phage SCTP-2]|nr:hypothetical protein PBI_SCTP2_62 [Salicola phage SCTP-2]